MICPQNKCPKPTTDFSNLRAHGRSEIHQMQLTYQVSPCAGVNVEAPVWVLQMQVVSWYLLRTSGIVPGGGGVNAFQNWDYWSW